MYLPGKCIAFLGGGWGKKNWGKLQNEYPSQNTTSELDRYFHHLGVWNCKGHIVLASVTAHLVDNVYSKMGQPTSPSRPFILLGSIDEQ